MSSDMRTSLLQYKSCMETFKGKTDLILSVLKELEKLDAINYQLLKETGIGKAVNNFRKVEGPVGVLAKKLVSLWKDLASTAIKSAENEQNSEHSFEKVRSSVTDSSDLNEKLSERYLPQTEVVVKQEKLTTDLQRKETTDVRDRCASTSEIESIVKKEVEDSGSNATDLRKGVNATDLKKDVKVERTATPDLAVQIKQEHAGASGKNLTESKKRTSKEAKIESQCHLVSDAARKIKQEKKAKSSRKDISKKQDIEPSFEDALLAKPKPKKSKKGKHLSVMIKSERETEPSQSEAKIGTEDTESFHSSKKGLTSPQDAGLLPNTECVLFPVQKEKNENSGLVGVTVKTEKDEAESCVSEEPDMMTLKVSEDNSDHHDGNEDLAFLHGSVSLCKTDCDLAPPRKTSSSGSGTLPHRKAVQQNSGKKTLALSDYKQLHNIKKEKPAHDRLDHKTQSGVNLKDGKGNVPPSLDKLQSDLDHFMNVIQCKQRNSSPSTEFDMEKESSPKNSSSLPKAYVQNLNSSPEMPSSQHRDSSRIRSSNKHESERNIHQAKPSSSSRRRDEFDQIQSSEKRSSSKGSRKPSSRHGHESKHDKSGKTSDRHSSKSHRSRQSDTSNSDLEDLVSKRRYSTDSADNDSAVPKSYRYSEQQHSQSKNEYIPSSLTDEENDQKDTDSQYSQKDSKRKNSKDSQKDCEHKNSKGSRKDFEHRSSKHSREVSKHRSSKTSPKDSEHRSSKHSREDSEHRASKHFRKDSELRNSKDFQKDSEHRSFKTCQKDSEHRSSKGSQKDSERRSSKNSQKNSEQRSCKDYRDYSRHSHSDSSQERTEKCSKDSLEDFPCKNAENSQQDARHKSKDSQNSVEHKSSRGSSKQHEREKLEISYDSKYKSSKDSLQDSEQKSHKTSRYRHDQGNISYEEKHNFKRTHEDSSSKDVKQSRHKHTSSESSRHSEIREKSETVHSSSKEKHKHASEKHKSHKKHKRGSPHEDDRSSREDHHKSAKKHKSSSEKSHKRKRKLSDGGVDASSGQTFDELMATPSTDVPKKRRSPTFEQKIAKTVAEKPLPQSYLNDLPELVTDYKPLPRADVSARRHERAEGSSQLTFSDIKASSRAESVYSGRRRGYSSMHSLMDLCLHVLGNNIDDIGYVGGVPFSILEPVLKKASARQLLSIEEYNADFTQESDNLWKDHCARDFKNVKPDEFESWRELYLRRVEEREKKLELLQSKISAKEQQKSSEAKKSMMAYTMSSTPKPPREVRRQQAKYGTASGSMESTARAAAIQKQEQAMRPYISSRSSGGSSRDSKGSVKVISVPPLMKKARKFMNRLHR